MGLPTIGEMITQGMKDRGITQIQAAQELECSKQTFSHWTRGFTVPALDRAEKIAEFTGRPIGEVIEAMLRGHGFEAELASIEATGRYINSESELVAA